MPSLLGQRAKWLLKARISFCQMSIFALVVGPMNVRYSLVDGWH
jgi:hypothetical protein